MGPGPRPDAGGGGGTIYPGSRAGRGPEGRRPRENGGPSPLPRVGRSVGGVRPSSPRGAKKSGSQDGAEPCGNLPRVVFPRPAIHPAHWGYSFPLSQAIFLTFLFVLVFFPGRSVAPPAILRVKPGKPKPHGGPRPREEAEKPPVPGSPENLWKGSSRGKGPSGGAAPPRAVPNPDDPRPPEPPRGYGRPFGAPRAAFGGSGRRPGRALVGPGGPRQPQAAPPCLVPPRGRGPASLWGRPRGLGGLSAQRRLGGGRALAASQRRKGGLRWSNGGGGPRHSAHLVLGREGGVAERGGGGSPSPAASFSGGATSPKTGPAAS